MFVCFYDGNFEKPFIKNPFSKNSYIFVFGLFENLL